MDPILSHLSPVQISTRTFLRHFLILSSCTWLGLVKWFVSVWYPHCNFVQNLSFLACVLHPLSASASLMWSPSWCLMNVQILTLCIMCVWIDSLATFQLHTMYMLMKCVGLHVILCLWCKEMEKYNNFWIPKMYIKYLLLGRQAYWNHTVK